MKKARNILAAVAVVLGVSVAAFGQVTIETVHVGNAGNAADTRYGERGSVGYEFNIGKYEVTAGQYATFLNKVAGVDTYGLYSTEMWSDTWACKIERYAGSGTPGSPYQYQVAPDYANRPANYVNWGNAARFANWVHNGQPTGTLTGDPAQDAGLTEDGAYDLNGAVSDAALLAVSREPDWKWAITSADEWYKAAYHDKTAGLAATYFDYPTRSNSGPGRDMTEATNPGNNANYGNLGMIQPPYYTTAAGEFELSDSPYGTFDQGGNVFEWLDTIVIGKFGTRGGSYRTPYVNHLAASYVLIWNPTAYGPAFGFRVSEVPEPATLSLLALGGLAMLRRRRGR